MSEIIRSEEKGNVSVMHFVIAGAGAGIIAVLSMVMTLTTSMAPGASYFWLPAAFQLAFAIWFGFWGCLASAIGTFLGGLWGGSPLFYNFLINPIPAFLANSFIPWLSFKALRLDPALRSMRDLVAAVITFVVASVVSAAMGAWATVFAGMGAPDFAWGVVFPGWAAGDTICAIVLGIPMLRFLTDYVKRSGMYVKGFFA
ncbi:MAG: hypothetical protein M1136_07370 [Chloroflexi bacterium]|nr:hypothetical protein [Chloroflexota bacterium]MCL5075453.1 hypothetical protein [Chloroflexota bacterium]